MDNQLNQIHLNGIKKQKKIMIPESISSGILNPNSIIEIKITDKQIIGVLPNKTT